MPGYLEDDGEARGIAVARERGIGLDMSTVRDAQAEALAQQAHDGGEAWIPPSTNGIRRHLDAFHDGTFLLVDNLIRLLDLSWTRTNTDYHAELSSLSLVPMVRVGGRSDDGDYDVKLKVRLDTALPGLERRIHLVFDNLGRDDLPGSDPMKRESDWRFGLRSGGDLWEHAKFDLGGGLRLRSMRAVGFAEAAVKFEYPLAGGRFRLVPRVFYYTDEAWGQDLRAAWLRWFGPRGRWGVELSSAEKNTDHGDTYDFEHTVKLAFARNDRQNRGWVFQASLFPHLREGTDDYFIDNALLNVSWKAPLYRRWCYAIVTPQVDFAKEDDRHAHFSLRFSLEILFGGDPRPLL
jgi:hypothetical protein